MQIKATQRKSIALTSEPDHLLVLRLNPDGSFVEEYNGPGETAWLLVSEKPGSKNGQYQVPLSHLRKFMNLVAENEKIERTVA